MFPQCSLPCHQVDRVWPRPPIKLLQNNLNFLIATTNGRSRFAFAFFFFFPAADDIKIASKSRWTCRRDEEGGGGWGAFGKFNCAARLVGNKIILRSCFPRHAAPFPTLPLPPPPSPAPAHALKRINLKFEFIYATLRSSQGNGRRAQLPEWKWAWSIVCAYDLLLLLELEPLCYMCHWSHGW